MSEHALEPTEPGQPRDDEHPSSDESGERPELRAIPVAGRQRASDLPPPPRTAPANAVVPTGEATPVPTTMLDSHQDTVARSSRLREDLLANPRRTIRRLYEEEHPEWRLDRNATFALPPGGSLAAFIDANAVLHVRTLDGAADTVLARDVEGLWALSP